MLVLLQLVPDVFQKVVYFRDPVSVSLNLPLADSGVVTFFAVPHAGYYVVLLGDGESKIKSQSCRNCIISNSRGSDFPYNTRAAQHAPS